MFSSASYKAGSTHKDDASTSRPLDPMDSPFATTRLAAIWILNR